jgi:hypothetical protein
VNLATQAQGFGQSAYNRFLARPVQKLDCINKGDFPNEKAEGSRAA